MFFRKNNHNLRTEKTDFFKGSGEDSEVQLFLLLMLY